jgi:hypothetical protein
MLNVFGSMSTKTGADVVNGAGRGEKGERRGNDLIASADVQGAHGEQDRVRTVGATDGMRRVRQRSHFRFERRHRVAEDERLGVHDAHDGGHDFVADRRVLRLEVEQGYGHAEL